MWTTVTSALSDGIKEFKAAFDEDSDDYQEEIQHGTNHSEILSSPEIVPKTGVPRGQDELEPQDAQDGIQDRGELNEKDRRNDRRDEGYDPLIHSSEELLRPDFPVKRSATMDQSSSWEFLMQENELRRLKQEIDVLKAKNEELEKRVKELTEVRQVDTSSELKEENRLLKKTMAQLMDRLADLEVGT
ncbi:putative coiled-coil protein [Gregarina niphandrodes]|uniref:Coiled-coil protein n=1 Tax=Gregarina niphandrodes TaxID=110365 RepID=A0A023B7Y4_GRENI|nr:putative coiled-coil protein [Gregarina niphandrodes]EZG68070.1 putative coiled-coil protein [Gregarina niphandrodes]|eukprot:XP_011130111.1 putative coiled-coil protein [Gregarina niphandrodes]